LSPADEAASDRDKGFVDDGKALETNAKPAEVVKPGDRSFDNPACLAETAPMQRIAPRDQGTNPLSMERATIFVVIVSAVGLDEARFAQWAARQAADRWDRRNQRQQLGDIIAVGPGQDDRERDALGFGDEMVFGAGASAVGGVRSYF
jgi:hypothetical protein